MNSLTSIKNAITDLPKNFDGEFNRTVSLTLFCSLDNNVIGRYELDTPLTDKKFIKKVISFTADAPHIAVLVQADEGYSNEVLSDLQWVVIDQQWCGLKRGFIDGLLLDDQNELAVLGVDCFDANRKYREKFLESFPESDIADSTFEYIRSAANRR